MEQWLAAESEKWLADGIVTPEQCRQIQMRYPVRKTSNHLLVFFAMIGAVMIGAGIILVFATNWWGLPVEVRIALAFTPLLLAQAICVYIFKKKYDSVAFREGGAVFLSLTFFAVVALIGQVFHTSSDLSSYLLVCILFSLPAAYLFRSKAVITIYAVGSIFVVSEWPWMAVLVVAVSVPFFYLEFKRSPHRRSNNYLLLLLCGMVVGALVAVTLENNFAMLEIAMLCGIAMMLIDALFRKIGGDYYFTCAKLLSILCITVTILVTTTIGFLSAAEVSRAGTVAIIGTALLYFVVRLSRHMGITAGDCFCAAALALVLLAHFAAIVACVLAVGLGVFFIVRGNKMLSHNNMNYGMLLIMAVIVIRFFDSDMGLLSRGIVFILLGVVFLIINLQISRKRKELGE